MQRYPSSSPARKRQRLSSPTYDEQVEDLTEEHLAAFDAIEARLSQETSLPTHEKGRDLDGRISPAVHRTSSPKGALEWGNSQPQGPSSSFPSFAFVSSKAARLPDDPENPFSHGFSSASKLPATAAGFTSSTIAFASASKLQRDKDYSRSPSPEALPPEPDYDAWFKPAPMDLPTAFVAPKALLGFASAKVHKDSTSASSIIMPSKEALAKAKAKYDAWMEEDETDENAAGSSSSKPQKHDAQIGFKSASNLRSVKSPPRPPLRTVLNPLNSPGTPTPAGFSRPIIDSSSKAIPSSSFQHRPTAFKSPLHKVYSASDAVLAGSPLNPNRPASSLGFTTAASQAHPLSNTPLTVPRAAQQTFTNSSALVTPLRSQTSTPSTRTRPARFVTPFKQNMKPGEAGRLTLGESALGKEPQFSKGATPALESPNWLTKERSPSNLPRKQFFCMTPPPDRQTLESSGLQPQQYDADELESMGVSMPMLDRITPETALYYSFHTTSSAPPCTYSEASTILGPAEALKDLLEHGCTLATKPWVDNHWCLILWKLAGMIALDPEKESDPEKKRWCWAEVMRQLLYRYERELNSGIRPPLRKIANQDAPAAFPMVLCISNVFWSPGGVTEDGLPIEPHPELELTDGWYRLRAQLDLPMARAVRKGVLRVGRKIGIAGAKLSTEKKDPTEILEAYNSTKLVLSGNSSHLMPWHAKLGFTRGPCISTLHSLSADGGVVAAMDFVIIKIYPIAFLEFMEDENGQKHREGPRNEAEETKVNEQWKRRREVEASKLKAEVEKKYVRYEGYLDRLERKAGSHFQPQENDYPPENIDSLYDELEYPDTAANVIAHVNATEAGWLALHIRKQTEAGRELIGEEIEKELRTLCPPRDVRSFRILVVQDSRTSRRPANRTAQLTVWDVLALTLDEGSKAGTFDCGQRYLATNLVPAQMSAWMDCEPGSEVYLSTRRDTRWTRIKTTAT